MEQWKNKVAVVTGASSGIGAAITKKLVAEGLKVVGLARRKEKIEELAKDLTNSVGSLHAFKVDLSNEDEILKAFQWISTNLGAVHILINNAGITRNTNLSNGDSKMWKEIIDINVLALCITTREALKNMELNKVNGHIIHINSMSGHRVASMPNNNVYPASKYAVTALTETLRQELTTSGSKIKVTSISPGAVETDFLKAAGMLSNKNMEDFIKNKPRLKAEDVAEAVLYALSTPPHVQVQEIMLRPVGSGP